MGLAGNIDEKGEEMVRRLLLDISEEAAHYYTWTVSNYDEKVDRRCEDTHWDLAVKDKKSSFGFMVQVKSSLKDFPSLEVKHISDWIDKDVPTVLVVYLLSTNECYWLLPQLLIASKGGIPKGQAYWKPRKAEYTLLNKANAPKLVRCVCQLQELQKKKFISASFYPDSYAAFSRELVVIDYTLLERKLLNCLDLLHEQAPLRVQQQFRTSFLPKVFELLQRNMSFTLFTKYVRDLFRTEFASLYKNYYACHLRDLEIYLFNWLSDIHRVASQTKLTLTAYRHLQEIAEYAHDGDWNFRAWSHGSLWTVSNLARFYDQDVLFDKLQLILAVDSNPEVLNAATYLLRHIQPVNYEPLFYKVPYFTDRYAQELDSSLANNVIEYHLRYATMMHGDPDSTAWLLNVATTAPWREIMLAFNLQHASDDPKKYIRSMTLKVEDPRASERAVVNLSKLILRDYRLKVA